jgi:AcrR family transcriptional regulator
VAARLEAEGRAAATAAALVEAGVQLLRERGDEALRRLLTAQDVARRAGVHRQTFYRHWPDPDAFVAAVANAALAPIGSDISIEPLLRSLRDEGISGAQELVRRAATFDYELLLTEESIGPQMLIWGIAAPQLQSAGDRERPLARRLAEPLADAYERLTALVLPYYEQIAASWGRQFSASFTPHDFAVTLTGLVEGLALRALLHPEAVREDLFADVIVALIERFTELVPRAGGSAVPTADDALPELPPSTQVKADARRARTERSREAIVEAATFEFEMRGFEATTIADIAHAAGLTEATVFRHFGSKNMIAVHVFARHVPALRAEIDRDLAGGAPLEALRNHLRRLGRVAKANPGVADGMLEAIRAASNAGPPTSADDPRRIAPLPHLVVPVIVAAQARGDVRDDLPPFEIAATMTNLTLLHSFTRPTFSAERSTGFLYTLLVDGLAPR